MIYDCLIIDSLSYGDIFTGYLKNGIVNRKINQGENDIKYEKEN